MIKLAILTDANHPQLIKDEQGLIEAFTSLGFAVDILIWDRDSWEGHEAILVRTPWDYAQKSELFKQKIIEAENKGIQVIHNSQILFWNMDKSYLQELADKCNVVPTKVVENFTVAEVDEYFAYWDSSVLVFKPKVGAGGKNTFKLHKNDSYECLKVLENTAVLVQPFIPTIEQEGEYSFIYFADQFSHAVVKTAKSGEFRIQDDYGGSVASYNPSLEEIQEIERMLETLPFKTVYARVDVVKAEGKFQLMELEIIEPELFFRFAGPQAMKSFARAVKSHFSV